MKQILLVAAASVIVSLTPLRAADSEEGFTTIFDGMTFTGWKSSIDNPNTWKIEDGAFVARGSVAHLFYVGDTNAFRDFELKVDVMTEPGSNGGIYFHTAYQERGFPNAGIECQVNVSHGDWIKTGSLYGLVNFGLTPAKDNQWWTQHIIVRGRKVTVKIDGKTILEYNEPPVNPTGRGKKLSEGTFALQAHDPKSIIHYKNIRVKRLGSKT
ncbi:MAG TPA: DUF1080 domain-containing protein [Verrucomicrobiae bacterium]|nr:DUF1080 domain-containing protein [Verrucomicrobiae bacterium]